MRSGPGILFVHAHPDDESITCGATMARYASDGAPVTLVTCTLGEEGEIFVPEFAHLAASEADQLGGYRIAELARACEALRVRDHRFLGGAGRFRDSGMMGLPANEHPRAFWRADTESAAAMLIEVIDDVRPEVVVTYDPGGGYGHPDHIQAHRVTMAAVDRLEAERGERSPVRKVYWTAMPRSVVRAGLGMFAGSAENPFADVSTVEEVPFAIPDSDVTTRIDASTYRAEKMTALRAHATQIPEESWLYVMADNFGVEPMGVEYFRLARGRRGPGTGVYNWEDDLFA